MKQLWTVILFATIAAALFPAPDAVAAQSAPTVVLNAYRVLPQGLQPLGDLRPGDTVEYEAVYRNPGDTPARNVMLTVPVPAGGLQFIGGTAAPAATFASLDGRTFSPVPLMRTVTLDDGRKVQREVPVAEYRFLRWTVGDVPAGGARAVRARMQLPALGR